ncbi:alkaline phosphatase [Zymobacter palmae]|uniref:Alkaline phosphatase n=1 Tax=Zymobacter palmae TaxID=33074 RepID=A0A348HHT1_9GAMM|nr:alkaline phosphatase [Zymobacter palmae]BBG31183.1 alkaline phosphatase [Zymobacter palmae]
MMARHLSSFALPSLTLCGTLLAASLAQAASVSGPVDAQGAARRGYHITQDEIRQAFSDQKARNVILFIGDGMGDSEITSARNYAEGAAGRFKGLDAFPFTGQYTTFSLDRTTHRPDYVTDSAASATGWTTGTKSYNKAIGVDVNGRPMPTLLELAKASGKATGNVTTAEVQDATPAALMAHVALRSCKGPDEVAAKCAADALENGGAGSIAEQSLNVRPDIIFGGGRAYFEQQAHAGQWKGQSLLDQASARGYQLVGDRAQLSALKVADQKQPVLGLFAANDMPVNWDGPKATHNGHLDTPPAVCTPNPERPDSQPSLKEMTRKAISLLDKNPTGFFLQVEGASIDKQDHAANPCGQIGEVVDLDQAIQEALAYAKTHPDTLVLVTADHAHSSQIIPTDGKVPGLSLALRTHDNAVMAMSYATASEGSQEHTGTQLRIAATGPRAGRVLGLTDQTDLFFTIRDALGISHQTTQNVTKTLAPAAH